MDNNMAVLSSAAVAVIYTFFGGMYSVAITDVIQLFFILFGLVKLNFTFQKGENNESLFQKGVVHSVRLDASGRQSKSFG